MTINKFVNITSFIKSNFLVPSVYTEEKKTESPSFVETEKGEEFPIAFYRIIFKIALGSPNPQYKIELFSAIASTPPLWTFSMAFLSHKDVDKGDELIILNNVMSINSVKARAGKCEAISAYVFTAHIYVKNS